MWSTSTQLASDDPSVAMGWATCLHWVPASWHGQLEVFSSDPECYSGCPTPSSSSAWGAPRFLPSDDQHYSLMFLLTSSIRQVRPSTLIEQPRSWRSPGGSVHAPASYSYCHPKLDSPSVRDFYDLFTGCCTVPLYMSASSACPRAQLEALWAPCLPSLASSVLL